MPRPSATLSTGSTASRWAEMYVIRLWNGSTLPNQTWDTLEIGLARSVDLTVPELRAAMGREGRAPATCGETVNWQIGRLWWHIEVKPPPWLCSRRWRRHTSRTFLPWEDWTADPPDNPGGDFQ
jgi:hypothetical protein